MRLLSALFALSLLVVCTTQPDSNEPPQAEKTVTEKPKAAEEAPPTKGMVWRYNANDDFDDGFMDKAFEGFVFGKIGDGDDYYYFSAKDSRLINFFENQSNIYQSYKGKNFLLKVIPRLTLNQKQKIVFFDEPEAKGKEVQVRPVYEVEVISEQSIDFKRHFHVKLYGFSPPPEGEDMPVKTLLGFDRIFWQEASRPGKEALTFYDLEISVSITNLKLSSVTLTDVTKGRKPRTEDVTFAVESPIDMSQLPSLEKFHTVEITWLQNHGDHGIREISLERL